MSQLEPNPLARRLFLILVALLPLHTVYVRAEIAIKPWLLLIAVVVMVDIVSTRSLPWSRRVMIGLGVFLLVALVSGPGWDVSTTGWRLWLALVAGGLLLLVTGRHAVELDAVLRVVFWSAAVMAATAFVLGLVTNGVFGEQAVARVNDLVLLDRVNKPAYLGSGFVALTNWHQDPGYAALWTNVWFILSVFAWMRGSVSAPRWVGPTVLGGLMAACVLTFSRTGWLGMVVAILALLFAHWRAGRPAFAITARLLAFATVAALVLLGVLVASDPEGVGGDVVESVEFRLAYLGVLGQIDLGEEGVIDPNLVVGDNRLEVWKEYIGRFDESPLLGIGLGRGWGERGLQEPHNLLLELLVETGVLGLIGFGILLFSMGRSADPVSVCVLVVVGLAGLTQTVLFEPVLWFGLGLWLAARERNEERAPAMAAT